MADPGTIFALAGPLGAGKTVLAHGIALGLGVTEWRGSPTYNIVHEYEASTPMLHIDAYRLTDAELDDLDLAPAVDAGAVVVVEWAANVPRALEALRPRRTVTICMTDAGENRRRIEVVDAAHAASAR